MWQRPIKKMLYLLNIGNFAPEVTNLTYPFIFQYAEKIGADGYARDAVLAADKAKELLRCQTTHDVKRIF